MREFVSDQTFFFDFIFNENSLCTVISIVCRPNFSSCMRMISNYDFYFIVVNRFFFFWIAENKSYQNHQMKLIIINSSKLKKNQNTIEKNEFYEWKIWRTIMKIMNKNNFICIKINSWFNTIKFRQHFFLSITIFLSLSFQQLTFSDLIWLNKVLSAFFFIIDFIQINISTTDFFVKISSAFISIIDSYKSTFNQLISLLQQRLR